MADNRVELGYGFVRQQGNEEHLCSTVDDPAQYFIASLLGLHLGGVTFGRLRADEKIDGMVAILGKQDERTRDNSSSRAGELVVLIRDGDMSKPDDGQYVEVLRLRHNSTYIRGISERIAALEARGGQGMWKQYPGDEAWDPVGAAMEADYAEAGQTLNAGSARWFGRTIWDAVAGDGQRVLSVDESIRKHRNEWRAVLGLPPLNPQ